MRSVINDKLKRKDTKNDIKMGLRTELNELQNCLSAVSLMSNCAVGNFNREFFNQFKPYLIKALWSVEITIPQKFKNLYQKIKELDDDNIFQLIDDAFVKNAQENMTKNYIYQNISTPYLDLKISDISLFSVNLQKSLFTLKRDMNFLNNDIALGWFYHSKTFDNSSQDNLIILNANLNILHTKISRRSEKMIDLIEKIKKNLT